MNRFTDPVLSHTSDAWASLNAALACATDDYELECIGEALQAAAAANASRIRTLREEAK